MSRTHVFLVLAAVGTLAVSPLAVLGLGVQPSTIERGSVQATTAPNATEVTSCRTIEEPGRYELTENVTNGSAETCIRITADDVVFDGNGHVVDGGARTNGTGITTPDAVSRKRSNVTVANVTVTNWQFGVQYNVFESGRIENVTVTDAQWGISLNYASITVANSTVANTTEAGIQASGSAYGNDYHVRLVGNELVNNRKGISLLMVDESSAVVRANVLHDNDDGLWAHHASNLNVTGNAFTSNADGIHVSSTDQTWDADCQDPPLAEAAVHGNAFVDNRAYGINNDAALTVNATRNYWGASDGPSSADDPDAPFVDPETHTPADGSGDAISEGPRDGVSNVHFDDALSENPLAST